MMMAVLAMHMTMGEFLGSGGTDALNGGLELQGLPGEGMVSIDHHAF
jgi:hypothetical protein